MIYFGSSKRFIRRGQEQSVVQRVADNSGHTLYDGYNNVTCYPSDKNVVFSELFLPSNAPSEYCDLQTFVTEINRAEKRQDAITAREFEFPFYKGLSLDERIDMLRQISATFFGSPGICTFASINETGNGYSHAYVILATRSVDRNGFSAKKNRTWNHTALVALWRFLWSDALNIALEKKGIAIELRHEDYHRHGMSFGITPNLHIGLEMKALLKKDGINTDHLNESIAIMEKRERKRNTEAEKYAFDRLPQ
jgi:hypothetical protein